MNKIELRIILILFILFVSIISYSIQQRDRFVFTQLKYDGDWNPYPYVYQDIYSFITLTTSIKMLPEPRIVTLKDKQIFYSPFIIMLNNGTFNGFKEEEREILLRYLNNGGILFIEDSSGQKNSKFNTQIRKELSILYPDKKLTKIENSHAIYKSFYLIQNVSGRRIINSYLEGLDISNRTAIIYSQNDILGAWARDKFGNYFYECIPGGDKQRFDAQKLFINIIIYSVTGTYKTDIIHKPFIDQRLNR